MSDYNPDDKESYRSPPASKIDPNPVPWGPFSKGKIPLDDYHVCPCCNGYGFVGIVNEPNPNGSIRIIPIDELGI